MWRAPITNSTFRPLAQFRRSAVPLSGSKSAPTLPHESMGFAGKGRTRAPTGQEPDLLGLGFVREVLPSSFGADGEEGANGKVLEVSDRDREVPNRSSCEVLLEGAEGEVYGTVSRAVSIERSIGNIRNDGIGKTFKSEVDSPDTFIR